MSGTSGQALRLEGIEIKLTGEVAERYDVYYRTHVQNVGWQDWKKNGEMAGTSGQALRLEGIEIKLLPKGTDGVGAIAEGEESGGNNESGDNGSNNDNQVNEEENKPIIKYTEEAPIVEIVDASGYYDFGLDVKYANENLYVEGFEFELTDEDGAEMSASGTAQTMRKTIWDYENSVSLVNEVEYSLLMTKAEEGHGRQKIRVRSYATVDGERRYSAYSDWLTIEYNKLNIDLTGGEMMSGWDVAKEDGVTVVGSEKKHYIYGIRYKLSAPNKYGYRFVGWTGDNGDIPQKEVYIPVDASGELNYVANWEEVPEEYYLTLDAPKLERVALQDDGRSGTETDYRLKAYYDNTEYYVDGFEVYKSFAEDGDFALVQTTEYGESENQYYDENGKRHLSDSEINRSLRMEMADREMYYKVRAFKMEGEEKKYSQFSDVVEIKSGVAELNLDGGTLSEYATADGIPNINGEIGYVYVRETDEYVMGRLYVYNQEYRLAEPTKEGYTFVGWTGSNGETPEKDVKIAEGTVGMLNYQANWVEGEPELSVARPTIVWKDSDTMAVRVYIGYTSHGDYADGFELGYRSASEEDFTTYSEWCSTYPYGGNGYSSLMMECSILPSAISSDVYLAARGYKNVEGEKVYGEWSEPVLVKIQPVEFDLNGGVEDGMGMGYGFYDGRPFVTLESTARGYIVGKRYRVMVPVREGYVFMGWTGSNGETPVQELYIEKDIDQPLHYKANWEKV